MRLTGDDVVVCIAVTVMYLAGLLTGFVAFGGTRYDTLPVEVPTMRCPEDADMVVRYFAGPGDDPPAGQVAFCVTSDELEAILP